MRQTYLGDGLEELLVVAHVVLGRIADYGMQRCKVVHAPWTRQDPSGIKYIT